MSTPPPPHLQAWADQIRAARDHHDTDLPPDVIRGVIHGAGMSTAARDHAPHADLVLTACHTPPGATQPPGGDPPGQITARLAWNPALTDVARYQLARTAAALLAQEQSDAIAEQP